MDYLSISSDPPSLSARVEIVNGDLMDSKQGAKKQVGRKISKNTKNVLRPEIDLMASDCLLENLFQTEKNVFIEKLFKRFPVVCRGNEKCLSRLKKLLFNLNIAELIQNSASEKTHIWLSQKVQFLIYLFSCCSHSDLLALWNCIHYTIFYYSISYTFKTRTFGTWERAERSLFEN